MLTTSILNRAGWISAFLAVILIPLCLVELNASDIPRSEQQFVWLRNLAILITAISGIYLLSIFLRVLNQFANFNKLDVLIRLLIGMNLMICVLVVTVSDDSLEGIVGVGLLLIFGIMSIVFGIRLLGCDHSLFGMRKKIAYANIATGVLCATVVGFFLTPIVGVFEYVCFSILFFRAADSVNTQAAYESADEDANEERGLARPIEPLATLSGDEGGSIISGAEQIERYPTGQKENDLHDETDPDTQYAPSVDISESVRTRLVEMKGLLDDGLINAEDYEKKKNDLLSKM
jgi:hypothetical protein